ncbi:MAG: hypothetical protein ABUK01_10420 [Leptospirales bacterium]
MKNISIENEAHTLLNYIYYLNNHLIEYNIFYIFLSVIIISIIQINANFLLPSQVKRKFILKTIEEVLKIFFDNKNIYTRITIFKKTRWVNTIFIYIWHNFIKGIGNFCNKKKLILILKNFPFRPNYYFTIYCRTSSPKQLNLSTIFAVPSSQSDIDSIVAKAWAEMTPIRKTLPNIEDIDLSSIKSIDELPRNKKSKVNKYMQQGYIKSLNKLKVIDRKSIHYYATTMVDSEDDPSCVFIIDNNDTKAPFDDEMLPSLSPFIRFIQNAINRKGDML